MNNSLAVMMINLIISKKCKIIRLKTVENKNLVEVSNYENSTF